MRVNLISYQFRFSLVLKRLLSKPFQIGCYNKKVKRVDSIKQEKNYKKDAQ